MIYDLWNVNILIKLILIMDTLKKKLQKSSIEWDRRNEVKFPSPIEQWQSLIKTKQNVWILHGKQGGCAVLSLNLRR